MPPDITHYRLRNLTSQPITLLSGSNEYTYEPDGQAPRINFQREKLARLALDSDHFLPINSTCEANVVGLPDPEFGTFLIVPSMVARYLTGRGDLLSIDRTVRSESGRVIGASGLAHLGDPNAFDDFFEESFAALV